MKISSYYAIMSTSKMDELINFFNKVGSLSVKHHMEFDEFDYYVMVDKTGNNTDFIQYKNKKMPEGFLAIRQNTDNFDEFAALLKEEDYVVEGGIIENDNVKCGLFVSKRGEVSTFIIEHKK